MGNGVLPVRGALALVERGIQDTITLALGKRLPAQADAAALAAFPTLGASPTTSLVDGAPVFVTDAGACYRWREASTAAAGAGVVVPADRASPARPGRWLLTSSSILDPSGVAISALATGYLRAVALYQGETSKDDWDQRIFSRRPAVLIQFAGHTDEQKSNLRGALKERYWHFTLWAISFNARAGTEAALGSPVAGEDPGASVIAGDLEDLLDGLTGAAMGVDGIDHLRVGEWSPKIETLSRDLTQRLFVWTAALDVRSTVGKEDRPTRHTLDAMTAQGVDPVDGTTPLTPAFQVIP